MIKKILPLLLRTLIFVLVLSALGIAYNLIKDDGVNPLEKYTEPGEVLRNDPRTIISVERVKEIWDSGEAIFIDTRSYEDYLEGHISGAFPIPEDAMQEYFMKFRPFMDPGYRIITYCDGAECLSSLHVADFLNRQGFPNVNIFFDGWELWKIKGYPQDKGEAF